MGKLTFENIKYYYEETLAEEFPELSKDQIKKLFLETLVKCTVLEEIKTSAHFIMENQGYLVK